MAILLDDIIGGESLSVTTVNTVYTIMHTWSYYVKKAMAMIVLECLDRPARCNALADGALLLTLCITMTLFQ
jgi:hypothetical protein